MKKLAILLTLVVALGLLAAPASAKTMKFAFQGDLTSCDPHGLNESFQLGTLGNVYEGLVRYSPTLEIVPCLATKWEVPEPTRWRFHLRKGVKFHNGNTFNADDVVFSYQRTLSEGSDMKSRVGTIEKVVKVDDYTVDMITRKPYPILTNEFASWYIMDKEWCQEHDSVESTNIKSGKENYATRHTNGTGPFIMGAREKDVKTVFKANPNWWDKPKGNLTEVVFTPIAQDATRVVALLSGEIDMMYPVPVQNIKRVNANKGTSALVGPELRTIFLGFNQHDKSLPCSGIADKNPFMDVRVRKAFYHAINIDAIKKKIMRGLSNPSAIMISPALFQSYAKDFKRYPYDPKKAKALLAEAGYKDGFKVCMDCPNNRYVNDEQICQAAVSMLAKIGIKVNLKAQPKAQYFKKVLAYDTEFFMLGWTPSSFDSYNVLFNLICSWNDKTGQGKFNLGNYSNKKVDELTAMIQSETDIPKRNKMIKEAYQIMHDEAGHIPLHQQSLAWGKKDNVDLVQRADNQFMWYYVTIK